jgi:Flp pilus assembly protein TadD/TolB-like protein
MCDPPVPRIQERIEASPSDCHCSDFYYFTPLRKRGIHSAPGDKKVHKRAAIVIVALSLWTAASAAANPQKLIVFPLDDTSADSAPEWLGEGIAISLSRQLDTREVKVMDRKERIELVERLDLPPGARLSRGSMIRVAQQASADLIVMGSYAGSEKNLKVSVRVLDVKALRLSGEMSANGSLSVLPQMENELAWLILTNTGLEKNSSREKFQERTRSIPNTAYSYYIESLDAMGENDQLHLLLNAVQSYRDFPEAQFQLGRLYFYRGDYRSAIPHLILGGSEGSTHLEGEFMSGTCYLQADQPLQAIEAFSRILQVSRPFEALNNIGVAYLREGDTALAINALQEARALARTDSTVVLNLAIAKHLQGGTSAARSLVEDAITAHPKNGMLLFFLGFLLKTQGEGEKAAAAMDKARRLGVNVEKLQTEDPKTWSRVLSRWERTF